MGESIFEIEHRPGDEIVLRFKSPSLPIMSEETRSHFRTAQKEVLLALRSLIDKAIERAEEAEKPKTKKRTKIEVQ